MVGTDSLTIHAERKMNSPRKLSQTGRRQAMGAIARVLRIPGTLAVLA
jgi:hypothetical protein